MALLVWVPWAISYFNRAPAPTIGIGGWGTQNAAGGLPITVVMIKEDPTIRLIGIAYHYDGFGDVFDAKGLQKSAPYDVRIGSIIILIKPDAEFLNEVTSGKHVRTNYVLISIPASLGDNPNFSTLRQATALGAKVLWTGIGPP